MELILKILFKPGQILHAIYIVLTGKSSADSEFVVSHMNLWVVSTMFWAFLLFALCWLTVLQMVNI